MRPRRRASARRGVAAAVLLAAWAATASGGEPVDYLEDVKPILAEKCFACHGALEQKSDLRLDAASLIRKGGASGPAIAPGSAGKSLLIERVSAKDAFYRMPPEGEGEPLEAEQLTVLRRWIDAGAQAPDETIPADPREHWAYQLPELPEIPQAAGGGWNRNEIDAFIAAKHEREGLRPVPPARKEILLRRVYLDLIGLPPTREELRAFLADDSPRAYEAVVERLLERPEYGERWGRHWMDVWRYSDWAGFGKEIRYSRPHVWRWRDWIVESLNADKGYDRMIVEMLAGDELAPADPDVARATGFLVRHWYKFDRHAWLDSTIEHTTKAFLGITLKCARCHDHKYDPISQQEYYRFRAIFEPYNVRTEHVPGEVETQKSGLVRSYDAEPEAATFFFERGDPKRPDKEHPVAPGVPAVIDGPEFEVDAVELPLESYYPALRNFVAEDMVAERRAAVQDAKSELAKARDALAAAEKQLAAERRRAESQEEARAEGKPKDEASAVGEAGGQPFLEDEFTKDRPEVWEVVRGQWEFEGGKLLQTEVVGGFSPLVTKAEHPQDFAAALKFKPTGGRTYRSVGLSFDYVEDRDFQAVYVSANDGRPTVSAFHRAAGKDVYPPQAIVGCPIKVGQEAELRVAVRGTLLNVWVDGELKLAYRLPISRRAGRIAIWTYDASAAFDALRVVPLAKDFELVKPDASPQSDYPATAETKPADAEVAHEIAAAKVALAEKHVATLRAQLEAVEVRVRAERAKYGLEPLGEPGAEGAEETDPQQLALAAGRAERLAAVAAAEEKLLGAEQALAAAERDADATDDKQKKAIEAARQKRDAAQKTLDAAREAAEKENASYQPLGQVYPKQSTGRRLALARWIADKRNPLTARVAVNHMWMRHFGKPLVDNVVDFGLRSPRPEHSDLLDFLAVYLMEHDWSMKAVHRLMVTSGVYRLTSSARDAAPANLQRDPDNRFLWRYESRRLEAEAVRDTILYSGGSLDQTMGGPDIPHGQGESVPRRSLYFEHAREKQVPFLTMFDAANPRECYRRKHSVRPQQAFALVNSSLSLAQSRMLARGLNDELDEPDASAFIRAAFETVLSRAPTDEELDECLRFLELQARQLSEPGKLEPLGKTANRAAPSADPKLRARENLVLVLFNHNEFVTVR